MEHSIERSGRERLFARILTGYLLIFFLTRTYGYYDQGTYLSLARMALFPIGIMLTAVLLFRTGAFRYLDVKLVAAYVVWLVVVVLWSHQTTLYSYERSISATIICLLCFAYGYALPAETRRKQYRLIFNALVGVLGLVCLVALVVVCMQTHIVMDLSVNKIIGLHPYDSYRLYLFVHPNQIAAILSAIELVCVYLLLTARKTGTRVYYTFLVLLFHTTIALTDSRANLFALAVCFGLLAFLVVYRLKVKSLLARVLLGALAAGVAGILAYGSFSVAIKAVDWVSQRAVAVSETVAAEAEAPAQQMPFKRDIGTDLTTFTGRTGIWKETVAELLKNPILLLRGTTGYHVEDVVPEYREKFGGYIHNSFLQVLVGNGLPGLLLLFAFFICLLVHSLRVFFHPGRRVGIGTQFLPAILLAALMICMVESIYFSEDSGILTPLFYLVGGLVVCESRGLMAAKAPPPKAVTMEKAA